jgi:hypothetical protein
MVIVRQPSAADMRPEVRLALVLGPNPGSNSSDDSRYGAPAQFGASHALYLAAQ